MTSTAAEDHDAQKTGKHSWTPEEDAKLTAAVEKYGACRWSMIAMHVASGRVGKQCRERWNNHLCPDVKKSEWSDAEDLAILQGVADMGTRWCEIVQAPALAGRTDNAIKNRFYALQRRSKAAHAVAARAAAVSTQQAQEPSPTLGKRQLGGGGGTKDATAAAAECGDNTDASGLRDKVMAIATAIACSTNEAERDRLIASLASTLHPRPCAPEGQTPDRAAKGKGGLGGRRPSPLSTASYTDDAASDLTAYLNDGRSLCPSPTPSCESAGSQPDSAQDSFHSDSSEDGGDLFAYALGETWADHTLSTPTVPAEPSPTGGPTGGTAVDSVETIHAATGTEEPGAAALTDAAMADAICAAAELVPPPAAAPENSPPNLPTPAAVAAAGAGAGNASPVGSPAGLGSPASPSQMAERLGACLGGRHKHKALLSPLEIPEVAEGAADGHISVVSALSAKPHLSGGGGADTPASAKRQRTPGGWASTPPTTGTPQTTGVLTPTGTDTPGATAPTAANPAKWGGAAPSPVSPLEAPKAPMSQQLQLSCFTDLFSEASAATTAAAAATPAAASAGAAARTPARRGGLRERPERPTPVRKPSPLVAKSPRVSSPLVPRSAEPWRGTRHTLQAATMVG